MSCLSLLEPEVQDHSSLCGLCGGLTWLLVVTGGDPLRPRRVDDIPLQSSRCPHSVFICVCKLPFYKDTSHAEITPAFMTSFQLDSFCKLALSQLGHTLKTGV